MGPAAALPKSTHRRHALGFAIAAAFATSGSRAHAEADPSSPSESNVTREASPASAKRVENPADHLRRLTDQGPYFDLFGTLMFGDGLRFNNPYRLAHELGDGGESLSTTAPYVDIAIVVVTGNPTGLVHGARFSWSVAMSGVPQGAFTPAYAAVLRPGGPWLLYGWAGAPFLTAPDFNVGAELGAAGLYFLRAGVGLTAAIVGDAFYGAGTQERRAAFYPVLSGQLGVSVNYEVLP